ncbi:WD domain, g-beta repeat domain-containing protein [Ditylenchus destructor]|uniref:Fizzy-related protein homolog n=1 Tax=Ditylenchus destructor TaxID=166010 RepID=A0AAD4RAI6_9BILA|nr:WD domain, g-beta repeat domain-containing protein [Ditylenchus destructor]
MLPLGNNDDYLRCLFQRPNSPQKFVTPRGSPQTTPTKYRPDGGDRYIPIRQTESEWATKYASISMSPLLDSANSTPARKLFQESTNQTSPIRETSAASSSATNNHANSASAQSEDNGHDGITHRALLKNELLKHSIIDIRNDYDCSDGIRVLQRNNGQNSLFKYTHKPPPVFGEASTSVSPLFSSSPLSADSQRLLKSPRKPQRKVPKNPYKVLDAPELQDDFYLNLVDWSSQNLLSVGLNSCVYLWSACNSQVIKLCDLSSEDNTVCSVQWTERGDFLAVGTHKGTLQIWDTHTQKKIHDMPGHMYRIGCLAWNGDTICSGSRDRNILQRDLRCGSTAVRTLQSHRQEVCGLKWSPNKEYLASGGNDNQLLVWSHRKNEPVQTYSEHNAAVKALAWSPHHHGVLVSGGGTADRSLRFWNTMTGQAMQCVETGSQVCNVAWSKHSSELVSTHGYSFNQVILWKYPSMQPITKLSGHQYRVLYLAMSPCGESIVTGAGDETLRFWHVFSKSTNHRSTRSRLNLQSCIR